MEETTTTVLLDKLPPKEALVDLPRYQPFTKYASALASRDVEIAGNRGKILISAVVAENALPVDDETGAQIVMTQPILTRPDTKRIVFDVPVAKVKQAILDLQRPQSRLEHIYDY